MDLAESAAYLRHHLALAGREEPLFAAAAIARLHRVASGLPRALNNAAVAALIAAAAAGDNPLYHVPSATIRAMPSDLERLPTPVSAAAPGAGPAALAGELLGRVRAELPGGRRAGGAGAVPGVGVADLTGLRPGRTRRAYAGDVVAWLGWLAGRETGALAAGRVPVGRYPARRGSGGLQRAPPTVGAVSQRPATNKTEYW